MNAAILAVAMVVSAPALRSVPKDVSPIVGEWETESMTMGGKPTPLSKKGDRFKATADGRWIIVSDKPGDNDPPCVYLINPKADPPTIDFGSLLKGGFGPVNLNRCIYKIHGDTLTICGGILDDERPKNFEPPEGSTIMLHILKRVKPKK
jgi:uncharacterized protein (TIGR03067 family)